MIQKDLKKQAETLQKLAFEEASKWVCPKCGNLMAETGAMTVKIKKGPGDEINGDYCSRCYCNFIAKNVPKFVKKKEFINKIFS